ncbi:hypothetical protein J6590_075282 [Homalodisca vitripennis]|nr:hypothetical protein J6590_075282 [Homalodisca vitripennis]
MAAKAKGNHCRKQSQSSVRVTYQIESSMLTNAQVLRFFLKLISGTPATFGQMPEFSMVDHNRR